MAEPVNASAIWFVNPANGMPAADLSAVMAVADAYTTRARTIKDAGNAAMVHWSAITGCYSGPGQEVVWTGMHPVGPTTLLFGLGLTEVSQALRDFVGEAAPILARLKAAKSSAEALADDVAKFKPHTDHDWSGALKKGAMATATGPLGLSLAVTNFAGAAKGYEVESWDQDQDLVTRNDNLRAEIAEAVALYQQAERRCANRINALYGGKQWHAHGQPGSEETAYGYDSPAYENATTDWGSPVERKESCNEKSTQFVPNFVNAALVDAPREMVTGLGGLVAWQAGVTTTPNGVIEGQSGVKIGDSRVHWSFNDWRQSKNDLGQTVLGVGVSGSLVGFFWHIPGLDAKTGKLTPGTKTGNEMLADIVKPLVAWDDWGKDPGTAAGKVTFNVGTLFIPVGEVGAGAKGADAAADAARGLRNSADALRGAEGAAGASRWLRDFANAPKGPTYDGLSRVGNLAHDLPGGRIRLPDVPEVKLGPELKPPGFEPPGPSGLHPEAPGVTPPHPDPGTSPHVDPGVGAHPDVVPESGPSLPPATGPDAVGGDVPAGQNPYGYPPPAEAGLGRPYYADDPRGPTTVGPDDIARTRERLNVGATQDTVAVGRTDIPGLEGVVFEGGSPTVRSTADLPAWADDPVLRYSDIQSPPEAKLPVQRDHGEIDTLAQIDRAITEHGIDPDVNAEVAIQISNPGGVCQTCRWGLTNEFATWGPIKIFSEKYPNITVRIKSPGNEDLIVRDGSVINPGRAVNP